MAAKFWVSQSDNVCHLKLGLPDDPNARTLDFTFEEWDAVLRIADAQIRDINAHGGHDALTSGGLILPGGSR